MIRLMQWSSRVLAIPAAMMWLMCVAHAHSHKLKTLEIVHPWCVETNAATSAVYMVVRNSARQGDRLVRASTLIAEKTELQAPPGVTAKAAFDVKPRGELILKRGASHILLTGLKKPLGAYDSFVMTLVFERAGKVEVEVQVEEASILEPKTH
jgi:copper(I)-binding protein